MSEEIPVLAEVVPKTAMLEGTKMALSDILNIPLVFTAWTFGSSKFKSNRNSDMERMTLQFKMNGEKHIVFTSSEVLIAQVRDFVRIMPEATCFKATIKRIDGKFLKFVG